MSRGAAQRSRSGARTVTTGSIRRMAIRDGNLEELPLGWGSYYTRLFDDAADAVDRLVRAPYLPFTVMDGPDADDLIEDIRAGCIDAGLLAGKTEADVATSASGIAAEG